MRSVCANLQWQNRRVEAATTVKLILLIANVIIRRNVSRSSSVVFPFNYLDRVAFCVVMSGALYSRLFSHRSVIFRSLLLLVVGR